MVIQDGPGRAALVAWGRNLPSTSAAKPIRRLEGRMSRAASPGPPNQCRCNQHVGKRQVKPRDASRANRDSGLVG